jgi:phosphoribosyl 1,2-cyclic phosphodiesterase
MRVLICGVRGSTPAPGVEFARYGGHTSCIAIAHDDGPPRLVLDAGTGIRRLTGLLDGAPFQGTILLTHLHWDHLQGLPFFAAADQPGARVTLAVPAQTSAAWGDGAERTVAKMMSPPHFPIDPAGLNGDWCFVDLDEGPHRIEDLSVLALEIPHKGGRTFGYRISDGVSTIAYVPDHSPIAFGDGPDGLGTVHPAIRALVEDVDVLFHDAQHVRDEFAQLRGFGHATVEYAVDLATACDVRRLLLFHHSPGRTDLEIDAIVSAQRTGGAPQIGAAVETRTIDLRR